MGAPAYAVKVEWDTLRSIAFSSILGTYVAIGSRMLYPIRLIKLYNSTDADLFISNDGINDKDIIPAKSEIIYDIDSNKSDQGGCLFLSTNQQLYVRYVSAPGLGTLYLTTIYGTDV